VVNTSAAAHSEVSHVISRVTGHAPAAAPPDERRAIPGPG